MLGSLLVLSAGCSHDTSAAGADPHPAPSSQSPSAVTEDVRRAAQAWWDEILTGQGNAAFQLLSRRCQAIDPSFLGQVNELANRITGGPQPFLTFTAYIHGDRARATYTFRTSALNQHRDPWVLEDGGWRWDGCDRPLGGTSKSKT